MEAQVAAARVAAAQVAVVASSGKRANELLVGAWRALGFEAAILSPADAVAELEPGDVTVVRLDVLETLDGVEPGLADVRELERRGQPLLNRPDALLAAHDKLETARLLEAAGLPHPRTAHVASAGGPLPLEPPLVIKPRFGSWGRDVFRCGSVAEAEACLAEVAHRSWFRRHGALVQELVRTRPSDLRLLVAGGRVVGAARRTAHPGQWRTNVSLGARLDPAVPPAGARELAVAAAEAIGADFVGIDLLERDGGWLVLELNGSVDFDERYSLPGRDVYRELATALRLSRP